MNNSFSKNIKTLRNKLDLTQKDFAEKIQVTAPTLNSYEKGTKKPNFDTLIKISQEFNISLDELCGVGIHSNKSNIVDTYSDLFKVLVDLIENTNIKLTCTLEVGDELDEIFGDYKTRIIINDKHLYEFIEEYKTMSGLRCKGSISESIFNEWYNSKISKYEKFKIWIDEEQNTEEK